MAKLKDEAPEVTGPVVEESKDNSLFDSESYAQGVKLAKEPEKVVKLDNGRTVAYF